MALKAYKPTSPARRGLILVDKSALWKGKPVKALTEGKRKTGGRNNKGHVTSRGIAGGHKQRYRIVDFKRRTWDVAGTVVAPGWVTSAGTVSVTSMSRSVAFRPRPSAPARSRR